MWVCAQHFISHFTSYIPWQVVEVTPFGEEVMAITSEEDARTQLPQKIF